MKSNEWNQHGINRINPNEILITQGESEEVHVTWHDFPEGNTKVHFLYHGSKLKVSVRLTQFSSLFCLKIYTFLAVYLQ